MAVAIHCTLAIEAAGEHCVAVKPQLACFERLGPPGWAALAEVVQRAHEHGLLVIADGKRGDIDVTATAYAEAFFGGAQTPYGPLPGLGADGLTVNPLLGADSLVPFVSAARRGGAGLFVLVRTSNPGARDVQELALADGGTVTERLARMVDGLGASDAVGPTGLADVGAVVGSTAPAWLERLRELMPRGSLPAARHRRPGRPGGGSGQRLYARSGRRSGVGLPLDRARARVARWAARRRGRRRGGAAAGARLERRRLSRRAVRRSRPDTGGSPV